MYPRVCRAAGITDESYIGFIGSLHHFTRLQSLAINLKLNSPVFELWESIGALISTGSVNSDIEILSIHFAWRPPPNSIHSGSLLSGLELVLRKAEDSLRLAGRPRRRVGPSSHSFIPTRYRACVAGETPKDFPQSFLKCFRISPRVVSQSFYRVSHRAYSRYS